MTTNTFPVAFHPSEVAGIQVFASEAINPRISRTNLSPTESVAVTRSSGVDSWSDAQLISSVRCDPPNEEALDALVARYWDGLFARCQMLTLNREKALDLAQAAWCRLLRTRHALKPEGNFPAYLNMISMNLFRDSYRAAQRAGPMADYRLESLENTFSNDDGENVVLVDVLPDLKSLHTEEQTLLAIDLDRALEQLTPQLREVLVARFIDGESCAEIGLRYGRTEQSISGWIREALRQMKAYLEEPDLTSGFNGQASKHQTLAVREFA